MPEVLHPATAHPTCDLDRQRRLREARVDAAVRAAAARRRGRRGARGVADAAIDLRDRGDDVWHALRY